jgi:hypothetical protein
MRHRIRVGAAIVVTLVLGLANPAFAEAKPQLIDGSSHGSEAFIAMAVMCFLFVGLLFLIDRVRQKAEDEQERRESGEH